MSHAPIDRETPFELANPADFPLNYEAEADRLSIARVDLDAVGSTSFLDGRQSITLEPPRSLAVVDCPPCGHYPSFLFHTAFCGSTLLARALHAPPDAVALKEPGVVLDLAMATLVPERYPSIVVERATRVTMGLLARPWTAAGQVLIKPTNQANRLLRLMLSVSPQSPALLLYSSLEQFLVSCYKKLPQAETRIRWMAQALLPGTQLAQRLNIPVTHPFNLVESAVLTWYAQMEIYAAALADDTHDRLRSLDIDTLLAAPAHTVATAADWLQLAGAHENLQQRVVTTFARNAKSQQQGFDRDQRDLENALVRERLGPLIAEALQWAESEIAPAATLPSDWKPLLR